MQEALALSLIFICLYLVLDSIEIIINRHLYGFDSPISTNSFSLRKIYRKKKVINILYDKKILILITVSRIVICILLIINLFIKNKLYSGESLLLFLLIVFELYFRLRCQNRLSSSEHIILFNLFCFTGYFLFHEQIVFHFISIFSIISYTSNGIQKISSVKWRSGIGLKKILKTNIYGSDLLIKVFGENKFVYHILSWFIIIFQLTFSLYLINTQFCIIYLSCGILFHLFLAIFMKLRDFFLAFLSSYPFLLFTFSEIHNISFKLIFFNFL